MQRLLQHVARLEREAVPVPHWPPEQDNPLQEGSARHYKSEQGRQWDATAPALTQWWPAFERITRPVTAAMVDHAQLRTGADVVDVASGFGEPALTIARLIGPSGRVVATDLSAAMLAVACQRADTFGVENIDILQMDAEEPALSPGRYDAVVCRLGLMFFPRVGLALRKLRNLLTPGGRFVAAVWGPPQTNGWMTLARGVVSASLDVPPSGGPGPFALAATGALEAALLAAGFVGVRQQRVPLRFFWPSASAYAAYHQASPMRRLLGDQDPERHRRIWADVAAAAKQRWGDGPLHLPGEILVASGVHLPAATRKPSPRSRLVDQRPGGRAPQPRAPSPTLPLGSVPSATPATAVPPSKPIPPVSPFYQRLIATVSVKEAS